MKKILAVGHSHLESLRSAYKSARQSSSVDLTFLQLNAPDHLPSLISGKLNPKVRQLCDGPWSLVVSLIGGNDHNILGLLNHPQRFDLVLPMEPDLPLDGEAEVIPFSVVQQRLLRPASQKLAVLIELRRSLSVPIVHLESPPPIPSAEHIKTYPNFFKDKIDQLGVAPATLRYKLWRTHSDIYAAACQAAGIQFIPAPPEMQDDRGMMIEQAWNKDPTHGNVLYGAHLLAQIEHLAANRHE